MKKRFVGVVMFLILCCNGIAVQAAEVAEVTEAKVVPNNITCLEDDPAADQPDYEIRVNRALNYTVVYAQDEATEEFTVPVIEFANSTGVNDGTPVGTYQVTKKHRWQTMFGGVYTQYAVRFMKHIMFHSPYYTRRNNNSTLNWVQYNKLGQQASSGCVREATVDSKWLYDHCKIGTPVIVYDDPDDPGPFAMPRTVTIPEDSPYRGWDPTDPDPDNPWQEVRPILHLTSNETDDKTLTLSSGVSLADLQAAIGLFTPEGVPYAAEDYALEIYGIYDLQTAGEYEIYVRGFDLATTLRADLILTLRVVP